MSILRIYDPIDCDEAGVPLDWERCRECDGLRTVDHVEPTGDWITQCGRCAGHGSLKAAALAEMTTRYPRTGDTILLDGRVWSVAMTRCKPLTTSAGGLSVEGRYDRGWATLRIGTEEREVAVPDLPAQPARCEDCGHPMSEGTWEGCGDGIRGEDLPTLGVGFLRTALMDLRRGDEPLVAPVHYSPCGEGCRHGLPARWAELDELVPGASRDIAEEAWDDVPGSTDPTGRDEVRDLLSAGPIEASWRQVDVRTLGWPHDLRPEKLAVLCLRCWAAKR